MRKELDGITIEVGVRLIKLFFKYIYPYFPILSRSRMMSDNSHVEEILLTLPLSLKEAVYASSLSFMIYDDYLSAMLDVDLPSAQNLYRISWIAITHEIHTPHLSTLQSCLLLLQRDNVSRYVQGSPFQWSLVAWTVSLAQTLGLSTDCSTWRGLPLWEKRLRRRLWWASYVLDKWILLFSGLASHIRHDDFDVLPLTAADFATDPDETNMPRGALDITQHQSSHFYHLVELTRILSRINDTFFTVRSSKETASNILLTFELAKPIRSQLHSWRESFERFSTLQQNFSASRGQLDGNISLGLAYPVVTMLLFRALMRPLETSKGSAEDMILRESSRDSIRVGAEACCVEIVNCIELIQPSAWNAFWHKFSPNFFAMPSSFMMRLLVTSNSPSEIQRMNNLIDRWRWAMRTGGGNAGNAMMSLGLLRLDSDPKADRPTFFYIPILTGIRWKVWRSGVKHEITPALGMVEYLAPPVLGSDFVIRIEPLTAASFASFGTAIIPPTLPAACDISQAKTIPNHHITLNSKATVVNQGTAIKISPISPLINSYPSTTNSKPLVSLLSCFPRHDFLRSNQATRYIHIDVLERHSFSSQTFVPLSAYPTARYLIIVAPSVQSAERGIINPPDLSSMRAFLATPSQAVTYAPGTWHAPMTVLSSSELDLDPGTRRIDFVVTQFVDGTERDCEEVVMGDCTDWNNGEIETCRVFVVVDEERDE
ncbi:Ureidoglycolate hydrolase [Penicillium expansum]|uniref:Ureidoglycolate hydrolase n=1 Tax=Penicillium expansum TaxID=27334 RepID=A0A0A2J4Y8_PENEN|nr:Ureidoglycolate hydrolase [Penicillium expansum]KGO49841.1 Ureidoglycolate hydrolase [Penicillium expansum]